MIRAALTTMLTPAVRIHVGPDSSTHLWVGALPHLFEQVPANDLELYIAHLCRIHHTYVLQPRLADSSPSSGCFSQSLGIRITRSELSALCSSPPTVLNPCHQHLHPNPPHPHPLPLPLPRMSSGWLGLS